MTERALNAGIYQENISRSDAEGWRRLKLGSGSHASVRISRDKHRPLDDWGRIYIYAEYTEYSRRHLSTVEHSMVDGKLDCYLIHVEEFKPHPGNAKAKQN